MCERTEYFFADQKSKYILAKNSPIPITGSDSTIDNANSRQSVSADPVSENTSDR